MSRFNEQGKLVRNKDTNFFSKPSVATTNFGDCCISWNFNSTGIALMVQSNQTSDAIEYSFNGTDVHGDMVPNFPSAAIVFDERYQNRIYFRRATAGVPVLVRVEAWRNDI